MHHSLVLISATRSAVQYNSCQAFVKGTGLERLHHLCGKAAPRSLPPLPASRQNIGAVVAKSNVYCVQILLRNPVDGVSGTPMAELAPGVVCCVGVVFVSVTCPVDIEA